MKVSTATVRATSPAGWIAAAALLTFYVLPLAGLFGAALSGIGRQWDPSLSAAVTRSLATSTGALALSVLGGTPLAWWLSGGGGAGRVLATHLVRLPLVLPPAVAGLALLVTFGPTGPVGLLLRRMGVVVPFTPAAVVMAQFLVASPLYVLSATAAFRAVDEDALAVARTEGARPLEAFLFVAIPMAARGLTAGAALCWTRAMGEFGATLLFAGNLPGVTQTMPLAIYEALETDVHRAVVLAMVLAAVAVAAVTAAGVAGRWFDLPPERDVR